MRCSKFWFPLTLTGAVIFILSEWPKSGPRSFLIVSLILSWMFAVPHRNTLQKLLHLEKTGRAIFCIITGWFVGMVIELSISGPTGNMGGLAANSFHSFLLAQGYYWTFPMLALVLIRKFNFSYWEIFFAAGLSSILEMFVLGIFKTLLSPVIVLAPAVFAIYITIYGMMIAIPLLFIDEKTFWKEQHQTVSRKKAFLITFLVLGVGNWLIYGIWAMTLQAVGVNISGGL